MTAYERLCAARRKGRPTAKRFIDGIFDGFIELHGDRLYGDDPAIIGGVAELSGLPFTVIGIEKGDDTKEKIAHNFGSPNPEGYRKALRLMRQAEKFHRSVVCIVDTSGAASILFKDASQVERAAESLRITAQELHDCGVVEQVVGGPEDFAVLCADLKPRIRATLDENLRRDPDALCADRYKRFRKFGGLKV